MIETTPTQPPADLMDEGPQWNEVAYEVQVNSLGGRYLGDIVQPNEVEQLFIDESNVLRLLGLGAISPYDCNSNIARATHTIPEQSNAVGAAPGTIVQSPLTSEQIATMSREDLEARGVIIRNKESITK